VTPIVLYGYALHSSQASLVAMSALTPKADIDQRAPHLRFVQRQNSGRTRYLHNIWLCRRSLDFAHLAMVPCGHLTIIPGDRDCIPTQFGNTAAVTGIASPINAVTPLEDFRFGGSH
jgi:hypothetical protein